MCVSHTHKTTCVCHTRLVMQPCFCINICMCMFLHKHMYVHVCRLVEWIDQTVKREARRG